MEDLSIVAGANVISGSRPSLLEVHCNVSPSLLAAPVRRIAGEEICRHVLRRRKKVRTFPNFVRSRAERDGIAQRVERLKLREEERQSILIISLEGTDVASGKLGLFEALALLAAQLRCSTVEVHQKRRLKCP